MLLIPDHFKLLSSKTPVNRKIKQTLGYNIPSPIAAMDKVKENQIKIIEEAYTKVGQENQVLVIPVGIAFDLAYKEKPHIKLHKSDGTHPNLLGTYLAACTVFASIYDKSPIGIEYDYYGAISKKDRIFLQKIAHQATSIYLETNLN